MSRSTLASHESRCKVCKHPERDEIEREFLDWGSPQKIATEFKLTRNSIYRHAEATGLGEKRFRNIRSALAKIVEHVSTTKPNTYAIVQAAVAISRINAKGEWIARSESINLTKLFERMTADELEAYARDGSLPEWFTAVTGPAGDEEDEGEREEEKSGAVR